MTTPTYDEAWINPILDALITDAQASGYFMWVNTPEPKRAPGQGLHAAVWVQNIKPIGEASGLNSTTGRLTFILRIYSNMLQEPQDAIDPRLMEATSNLLRRYHANFDLGGAIRNVDLLGAYGTTLEANAGYLVQDNITFRIMDITIPCIVNDIWPQVM